MRTVRDLVLQRNGKSHTRSLELESWDAAESAPADPPTASASVVDIDGHDFSSTLHDGSSMGAGGSALDNVQIDCSQRGNEGDPFVAEIEAMLGSMKSNKEEMVERGYATHSWQ